MTKKLLLALVVTVTYLGALPVEAKDLAKVLTAGNTGKLQLEKAREQCVGEIYEFLGVDAECSGLLGFFALFILSPKISFEVIDKQCDTLQKQEWLGLHTYKWQVYLSDLYKKSGKTIRYEQLEHIALSMVGEIEELLPLLVPAQMGDATALARVETLLGESATPQLRHLVRTQIELDNELRKITEQELREEKLASERA